MMGRTAAWGAALTFTMLSAGARAEDAAPTTAPTGGGAATTNAGSAVGSTNEWGGVLNGRTLGSGGGGVFARGGYPGFTAGALFGIVDKVDIGASAAPVYNALLETGGFTAVFGLDLRAIGRFQIVSTDTVSFLARIEPGVKFVTFNPVVTWGIGTDVAFDVGIKVMTGGSIYLGLEVPLFFGVDLLANLIQIPILPGAGFEYHVNDFIGVGARFNAGPSLAITTGVGGTTVVDFAMIAEGFFIFRWDRVK